MIGPSAERARIPAAIWALGFVSMLMDVSSEMIHALLPVYLVAVLGASALAVGVIEGIAEATASIVKVFSGALSDRLGRRKPPVVLGYGLAAVTKPVFALSTSFGWLVAARFVDRVGKGVRGAPRDALIADIAPPAVRGASFGLRQALDTAGAVLGPLLAVGLMALTAESYRTVFAIAVIPAVLAVALLVVGVREPERPAGLRASRPPLRLLEIRRLGAPVWRIVAVAALFALARFSEAFLLLKAQSLGLAPSLVPLVLVLMSLVYAASAYPAGALADRMSPWRLLALGLLLLLAADLMLAFADGFWVLSAGVVLWGLHMGLTQGVLAAMTAAAAPPDLRGTAFGATNLVTGLALLAASVIAGALWDLAGPQAAFLAGALFAGLTLALLLAARQPGRPR